MAGRPRIVGYQCAGVVREVGPQAQGRSRGQHVVEVMMHGSHAALIAVPAMMTWDCPTASM